MAAKPRRKKKSRGIPLWFTISIAICVATTLAWGGYDYYILELDDRPDHHNFQRLKPSGDLGYLYGVTGTILIFTNLLYLVRRRLTRLQGLGSMRTWLDLHVFTGLVGATVVAFHSSFQARSFLNQVTAVSLVIVVITGIIGRYLYAFIPRPELHPYEDALEDLDHLIPGIAEQLRTAVAAHKPIETRSVPSILKVLRALPAWRRTAHARREAVELIVFNSPALAQMQPRLRRRVKRRARKVAREAMRQVYAVAADSILRTWRALHRLFAIAMICTVITHIVVAWMYGYRWIFSE